MLKFFSQLPNRDNYIITKSPPEQFSDSKIKIYKIGDEIRPLIEMKTPS